MASLDSWSFAAHPPFPATVLPNYAVWNATNEARNITYQIGVSWPFEWESREVSNKTALTMQVSLSSHLLSSSSLNTQSSSQPE